MEPHNCKSCQMTARNGVKLGPEMKTHSPLAYGSYNDKQGSITRFNTYHQRYACLFLDEKQGVRNLKMRNFSRGKQTRKMRKCETKNQAFWKLLEEEMIENSK